MSANSSYHNSLNDSVKDLGTVSTANDLKGMIANLIEENENMRDQTLEMSRSLESSREQIYDLKLCLTAAIEDSMKDPLTELGNRRWLERGISKMLETKKLGAEHHCLALIDLDHFKNINDTFGHLVGDKVLLSTAVINAPEQIMRLDRDQLPELLCDVPNTIVPPIIRVSKPDLLGKFSNCENLCHFENLVSEPFVVRPTASHAGKGLELLSDRNELAAYTTKHDADEYFVSKFVDYRSADGNFRKYRIIFIDGKAYPFHLAIGDSWKLWYMNAHMGSCKKKLAEEADFLRTFDQYFATSHADALKSISERVDLEYFGIDCAVGKTGELIVFEADNAMIVHDMDAVGEFSYKQEAMASLFAAFEELILKENSSISNANLLNSDRVLKANMRSLA